MDELYAYLLLPHNWGNWSATNLSDKVRAVKVYLFAPRMWFGVAPPSPARVSRKDAHPPLCSCALHRLERDKRLEGERPHAPQSPRRGGGHQTHVPSTSGPLSSRQRGLHSDKSVATPRRQMQRTREATRGEERSRDVWDKTQPKRADDSSKKQHLQPEHGDEQSAEAPTSGEELLQLMGGVDAGGVRGENVLLLQQIQVQGPGKESEARFPGTAAEAGRFTCRPRTGLKTSLMVENQADIGTLPVTPLLTSRSRRPSIHRPTQSPRIDVDSFEEGNDSSRAWSTAPAPFASLHPEHLVGHAASVCALVAHDDRFIVSCSVDGSVKVWSQVTFECLHTIYGHRDVVSCVDLNARWLVSGSHDNTLRLYDCTSSSLSLLHVLTGHAGHVTQVRLPSSLPSCILSCSDDYTLRLWNAELGQFMYELRAHRLRVTCVDIQPDHICSGAADGSICFWDIGSLSSSPEHPPDHHLPCARIYYAHKTTVQCIVDLSSSRATSSVSTSRANSELCSVVVTGSNDGTIQLFSAKNFAHLGRLDNVGSPVYAAAPLSNGRLLCSTKDGRLLLYGNLFHPTATKAPAVLQLATTWISSLQCLKLSTASSLARGGSAEAH
ncbi:F-box/WD repeat-containing protein 9 [Phytophthora pseudosyringae]|uniref:F-box/WD repeat-containing protein 9 n=1 Tax=Phytophthora pseudosyringae TaxID=221518 RepID=A0A8T1VG08_9STRA|nr:F-box/WD repeat-containing protein 9 [Phytophthora pseudosyringae]